MNIQVVVEKWIPYQKGQYGAWVGSNSPTHSQINKITHDPRLLTWKVHHEGIIGMESINAHMGKSKYSPRLIGYNPRLLEFVNPCPTSRLLFYKLWQSGDPLHLCHPTYSTPTLPSSPIQQSSWPKDSKSAQKQDLATFITIPCWAGFLVWLRFGIMYSFSREHRKLVYPRREFQGMSPLRSKLYVRDLNVTWSVVW